MAIYALGRLSPKLPANARYWIAPDAHLIGDVHLGEDVSIWFGAVLRGDNEAIAIGNRTNVQEGAILHTDPGAPVTIGRGCTIGHRAIVHGCTIGDNSLVGMGATVLNRAKIGNNCIVGANALVTEGKEFPEGSLIVGSPARVIRTLDEATIEGIKRSADNYVTNWQHYTRDLKACGIRKWAEM